VVLALLLLLSFCELFKERLRRVELERQCGLADGDSGGFLSHLLPFEVSFESIKEESIMGHAVPVKDLLLLLRANAVALVEEVKESALGLLERSIRAGLEVSKIGKDALLELFGVFDGSAKGLKAKGQTADNVGAGDVEEVVPEEGESGDID